MIKNLTEKVLAAGTMTIALFGLGGLTNANQSNIVQASAFHYLNKKHTYKPVGIVDDFDIYNSKGIPLYKANYDPDYSYGNPEADRADYLTKSEYVKINGYKYINGHKFYHVAGRSVFDQDRSWDHYYLPAKDFSKKYNNLSNTAIYVSKKKLQTYNTGANTYEDLAAEILPGEYVQKGVPFEVGMSTINEKFVDIVTHKFGFGSLKRSDFKKYCKKAGPHVKSISSDGSYSTNAFLKAGYVYWALSPKESIQHKVHKVRLYENPNKV